MEAGIPYGMGFIKNKYIGRTFISPGKGERLDGLKIKLAAIEESVKGKRVVLVDDSIVRGNTMGRIVGLLREAGAQEVHVRISSPPFLHPCFYGTDIDSQEHLIACQYDIRQICQKIGGGFFGDICRSMPCMSLPETTGFCDACFSGCYPTKIPEDPRKDRFEQRLSEIRRS